MKHIVATAFFAVILLLSHPLAEAQAAKTYKTRLAPVPMDLSMAATVAGFGSVTAVLSGTKLTVNGTFEGLRSPATIVQVHKGQRGVRGPVVLDLQATKAIAGTITGTLDLTPQLLQDLQNSRLYVQLHSERAPDGNLWGWLMLQETKR
jgi:CHRD domain